MLPPWPTPLTYLKGRGGLGHAPLLTLAAGPTAAFHISPSRATARRRSPAAEILHHKHHVVVLLIQSISPPYLLDQGGRIRRCAICVHLSEASPLAALDRIGSQGGEG
jgi:hypothetical protein